MKEIIKDILYRFHLEKTEENHLIADINRDYTRKQKKILICYLDYMRTCRELRHNFGHTNRMEMMQMIRGCIINDWAVDVCSCYDKRACQEIRQDYYDYILGFGETFKYACQVNPKALSIIYMTENPYVVSLERESARIAYFKERTGRDYPLERTGYYYCENDERNADKVLCLGDARYFENIQKDVVRIWPSAPKNPQFQLNFEKKDVKNFLVYGVDGFVHKGNDLLIEVFAKHPDWTLFMCGKGGKEKVKKAGYKLPANVHAMEYVDTLSEQFIEIADQCYFLLLPSCSEAPSTAVLTAMRHGVLPVVSKGIGLDELTEYCRYFEDFSISKIEEKLDEIISEDKTCIQRQSLQAMTYADEHFNLHTFTESFQNALIQLIGI